MKMPILLAGALALCLTPSIALAQVVGSPIVAPAGYVPAEAIYCADSTGHAVACAISNVVQITAPADRGGVFGTTAVALMAANPTRHGWAIQNQSASATCYVNGTAAATTDYHSLAVPPGQYFEPDHHVSTGAISIICTAASTPVYAREW